MAFLRLSKTGIKTSGLFENSGYDHQLEVAGSQLNNPSEFAVRYNGQNLSGSGQGVRLVIFNNNMTISSQGTFDIHGSSTARDLFVSRINGIQAGQLAVLASRGRITSTNGIRDALINRRSTRWNHQLISSIQTLAYAAVIHGTYGVVYEGLHGGGQSDLPVSISILFDQVDRIGQNGFGVPIINTSQIYSSDGAFIYQELANGPIESYGIREGDWLYASGKFRVSQPAYQAGVTSLMRIRFFDQNLSQLADMNIGNNAVGGWEKDTGKIQVPAGASSVRIDLRRDPSGVTIGTASATGITVVRHNGFVGEESTRIGDKGIASEQIFQGPGMFTVYKSDTYFKDFERSSNLHNMGLEPHAIENVVWYTRTLVSNETRTVTKTSGSVSRESNSWIPISPNQAYWIGVWVRKDSKESGSLKLGVKLSDEDFNPVSGRFSNGSTQRMTPILQEVSHSDIGNDFVLMSGWILPSSWSEQEGQEFIDSVKYQFGLINDGSGVGVNGETEMYYGTRVHQNTRHMKMYIEDANNSSTSDIKWCLPIVRQVGLMVVGEEQFSYLNKFNLNT